MHVESVHAKERKESKEREEQSAMLKYIISHPSTPHLSTRYSYTSCAVTLTPFVFIPPGLAVPETVKEWTRHLIRPVRVHQGKLCGYTSWKPGHTNSLGAAGMVCMTMTTTACDD